MFSKKKEISVSTPAAAPKKVAPHPSDVTWSHNETYFCCGMTELGGFAWPTQQGYPSVPVDWDAPLSPTFIAEMRARYASLNRALTAVTLAEHQQVIEKVFEATGWKRVGQFRGNSGNLLTSWVYFEREV